MFNLIYKLRNNSIIRSSLGLLIITMVVKLIGYAEKLILAYYYGTSYKVDVYTLVITLVLSLFILFREIIEPGFLNVFLEARNNGDEKTAWGLFNKIARIIFFVTLIISVIIILFPDKVISIFAPGFVGAKFELSVNLIQIAIPACIFLALSALTSITLNGLKVFALPASGEIVFKGLIIFCLVIFYKNFGIAGAAIGIVLGALGRLLVHLIKLFDKISFRHIEIDNTYLHKMWLLTWPLLLGVTFSQVSGLVDNIFASYLQEGSIAALSYSKKIIELPILIFPYILSIVVFPYFSQLAIEKDHIKLESLFTESLRWIVIIFIPIAIFFYVYSQPIVEIMLQRGAFGKASTMLTSAPLAIYSIGLVFFAIETILVVFYYSNADIKTPIFVGIGCVILNIILTWILINSIGYVGIAVAYVIQKIIKNIILLVLLKRKIKFNLNKIYNFILKFIVISVILIIIILLSRIFVYNDAFKLKIRIVILAGTFLVSIFMYITMLHFSKELKAKYIHKM